VLPGVGSPPPPPPVFGAPKIERSNANLETHLEMEEEDRQDRDER
jgi:hypothetical protein